MPDTLPVSCPAGSKVQFVSAPLAGVPSAGAVSVGLPVQFVITPLAGVPSAGVVNVGDATVEASVVAPVIVPLPSIRIVI